jgi:hypothetical protein
MESIARHGTDLSPAGAGLDCGLRERILAQSMPVPLILVTASLGLLALLDAATLVFGGFRVLLLIRLLAALGMVTGLLRGSEGVRNLLYLLSCVGIVAGAVWGFQAVTADDATPEALLPFAIQVAASVGCAITLGLESVRKWMFLRSPAGRALQEESGIESRP